MKKRDRKPHLYANQKITKCNELYEELSVNLRGTAIRWFAVDPIEECGNVTGTKPPSDFGSWITPESSFIVPEERIQLLIKTKKDLLIQIGMC